MIRKIIQINSEKCNGCGICINACHEGAIGLKEGKAVLLKEDYCDGLGDCLPTCPTGAITFTVREAAAYDHEAVQKNLAKRKTRSGKNVETQQPAVSSCMLSESTSALRQWPVQIKLIPENAPWLQNADLLIAADCTAYAYGAFHQQFMEGKITVIACPKLDAVDYSEKLEAIFTNQPIRSVTVTRMEVPCCGGLTYAVQNALERAQLHTGRTIPLHIVTISTEGEILS